MSQAPDLTNVIAMYSMQTRLFNNAMSGITTEQSLIRPSENNNHVAWLAGHTVSTRYMASMMAGAPKEEPYPELFAQGKGIQDSGYPSIEDLTKDWNPISEHFIGALNNLDAAALSAEPPFPTPIGINSIAGFLTFLAHHEAYTIGQIGYLRKFLGHEAMKYD